MTNDMTPPEAARSYLGRGWMPVPVPYRSKNPGFSDWQHFTVTESDLHRHFNGRQQNVGVLLGKASGDLVDVDLDCAEAVTLAPHFLPTTGATFGRETRPRSHWLYVAPVPSKVTFTDPVTSKRMVEVLTNGQQAIFPGSTHKDTGEPIRWHEDGAPTRIDKAVLLRAVSELASATLLTLHWPQKGSRQDVALALAGGLLRAGWVEDKVASFIAAVCGAARDEEAHSRVQTVINTSTKLRQGAHVTGWTTLAKTVDERVIGRVREWLGIKADGFNEESEQSELWDPPAAFYEHDLPFFPVNSFPDWQREYSLGLARETQTPPDLAATLTLTVISGAVGGNVRVQARAGWAEPLNVYTATVLSPGNRKSAVFEGACEPLEEHERDLVEGSRDEIARIESEYRMLEERRHQVEKKVAKIEDSEERERAKLDAVCLAQELAALKVPVPPRLIASDVTSEALSSLLAEQGGRMCVLSAEGDLFDMLAGRYTSGAPNFDVILKGHSGDALRVDRRGRSEYVQRPALTIGLTVQPDVIRGLMDKKGFRGRGLLGRFLYSLPESTMGRRRIAPEPLGNGVRQVFKENVKGLARLKPATSDDGSPVARMLHFTGEADTLLKEFEAWLEPQLAEDGELGAINDWAGKLAGAVVRIAGVLHLAEHAQKLTPWPKLVAAETVSRAIDIGHYFIQHARAAFAEMGADEQIENAKRLLRWMEREGRRSFSKREAHQAHKGRFKKVTEIEPALELLEEHGYIRPRASNVDVNKRGRKPSQVFDVTPHLFLQPQNAQNAQNSEIEERFEHFENYGADGSADICEPTSHGELAPTSDGSSFEDCHLRTTEGEANSIETRGWSIEDEIDWLRDHFDEVAERAAIMEFDGGLDRAEAERLAGMH